MEMMGVFDDKPIFAVVIGLYFWNCSSQHTGSSPSTQSRKKWKLERMTYP